MHARRQQRLGSKWRTGKKDSPKFEVGEEVLCRDDTDDQWKHGVVEVTTPQIKVKAEGYKVAFTWHEIKPVDGEDEPEKPLPPGWTTGVSRSTGQADLHPPTN